MSQAGLEEVMNEMADQIRAAVVAVTDIDVQVESPMILNPTPPCIDVYVAATPRDRESAGFASWDDEGYFVTVRARVTMADSEAGQDLLVAFIDPTNDLSVGQALYDEPTLNGLASDLDIVSSTGYVIVPSASGGGELLGCEWTVRVLPVNS